MLKTIRCVDCRVEFSYEHRTGPTRQRCDACRLDRKKLVDREKSQRWKDKPGNRERHVAYLREYHQARKDDPEYRRKRRENMVRYAYGLEPAEVEALSESQGGRCAICRGDRNGPGRRLHIDHCHDTGKVRGMLCSKCNTAVGLLDNDPERAEKVAHYLRQ